MEIRKQQTLKNHPISFFDGSISKYFNGEKHLYLGDKDIVFGDQNVNITAELKTISRDGKFSGKKMSFNQAREYSSTVGMIDNFGRKCNSYLFEYHKYLQTPYVIVVPFKKPTGNETTAIELLDVKNALMMYVDKHDQFNQWLSGNRYIGKFPRKPLLCVNHPIPTLFTKNQ
jgi:hypothetical protein